jgi:hypothetical protein
MEPSPLPGWEQDLERWLEPFVAGLRREVLSSGVVRHPWVRPARMASLRSHAAILPAVSTCRHRPPYGSSCSPPEPYSCKGGT